MSTVKEQGWSISSHLVGLLSSQIWAVLPAPLHYKALQRLKHCALQLTGSWDSMVPLDLKSQKDLSFWITQLKSSHNGRTPLLPSADFIISAVASQSGWGACLNNRSVSGHWDVSQRDCHINFLEMKAAFLALKSFVSGQRDFLALKSFVSGQRDCLVLLLLNNITAISFINHKGGTRSRRLSDLAVEIWTWCLQRSITIFAEHLPG